MAEPQNPWVRVSERLPTRDEEEQACVLVAYFLEGRWLIEDCRMLSTHWQPPYMETPEYWTLASRIAPDAFGLRAEEKVDV